MRRGLVSEVIHYFTNNPQYVPEVFRARTRFWGDEEILINSLKGEERDNKEWTFHNWFIFDFKFPNGKTPLKTYYLTKYLSFSENDQENYKNLLKSKYDLWKVRNVELDKGLELISLKDGKIFYVSEKMGTHGVKKDDVILNRITKIDDHYELIGPDTDNYFKGGLENSSVGLLLRHKKLDPKIVNDCLNERDRLVKLTEKIDYKKILKKKIVGPNECLCDECHKKGKIGASSTDKYTGEPLFYCLDCTLKINAERNGTTVAQEKERREKMFMVSNLFTETKVKEYCRIKGIDLETEKNLIEKLNKALPAIQKAWNGLSIKERKSFDKLSKEELIERYSKIPVDFSGM